MSRPRAATAPTPVDVALREQSKEAAAKQEHELKLWETWKKSGHAPEHLEPLLNLYQPLINRKAQEFAGGLTMVTPSAVQADVMQHVIKAFETYNPDRGASLNTHVNYRVKKTLRYVAQHQNLAYIPENKAGLIGKIRRAEGTLQDELGRTPTPEEISTHITTEFGKPVRVKDILSIRKQMVKDIPSSSFETDPTAALGSRHQEVLSMLPDVLTPDEKSVFDLVYHPTNPMLSTTAIAAKLGKSQPQVARLKTSIITKIQRYL